MTKILRRRTTTLFAIVFLIIVTSTYIFLQRFNDYKLKKNLTAFQKREMESTVDNFILMTDFIRLNLIRNYEENNIEYDSEIVKTKTLNFLRKYVHEATYSNGAYIWINEVTDFNGGENYGIRVVHGNLPETEGMLLSTSMQDAKGNYPYLLELNGIKEKGEITYNYFFEEYKSDVISEKVTYAKLYEPYNWIICTGTYLNSMYDPAGGVSVRSKQIFYVFIIVLISFAFCIFSYILISNLSNSKQLLIETEILKDEIEKDSLTGAGSRSFGEKILQEFLHIYKTTGKNYSIGILDIDNFKRFNDCYGHNIGDLILINLVTTIKKYQDENDYVIRWGGDEFILVYDLPDQKLDTVMSALLKCVSEQVITTESGEKFNYSISIGASHFSEKDTTVSDAIKRIDDALYLSKRKKNSYYIMW